jgi:hypothetical protein
LPSGDVNLISHSHGGNVVLMSQGWSTRKIHRYVQLAVPVNSDFGLYRYALPYNMVDWRCQASSSADWVQFAGASPTQVYNFAASVYQSWSETYQALQALADGDYDSAFAYFLQTSFDLWQADQWWTSTKQEE